jgi:predicted transcriptional regulator
MDTQADRANGKLVRTSVLIPEDIDARLRALAAQGDRPLSREIRRALEDHVAREGERAAA